MHSGRHGLSFVLGCGTALLVCLTLTYLDMNFHELLDSLTVRLFMMRLPYHHNHMFQLIQGNALSNVLICPWRNLINY